MYHRERFILFPSRFAGFTCWRGREVQFSLDTLLPVAPEIHFLLAAPLVRAFNHRSRLGLSVDSAFRLRSASLACRRRDLLCPLLTSALRSSGLSATSVAEATQSRSPGVSSAAFRAQSPNLRFAPLMDMDFAVSCPLVRRWRLVSGFCSSTRTFVPCFLQTPPRGDSPCASLTLHLHQVG